MIWTPVNGVDKIVVDKTDFSDPNYSGSFKA